MNEYITSTDYERLWNLMHDKHCPFVVYMRTDHAGYRKVVKLEKDWHPASKAEFMEVCNRQALEFIDPASQTKSAMEAAAPEMYEELVWSVEQIQFLCGCVECAEKAHDIEKVLKKARGEG